MRLDHPLALGVPTSIIISVSAGRRPLDTLLGRARGSLLLGWLSPDTRRVLRVSERPGGLDHALAPSTARPEAISASRYPQAWEGRLNDPCATARPCVSVPCAGINDHRDGG